VERVWVVAALMVLAAAIVWAWQAWAMRKAERMIEIQAQQTERIMQEATKIFR